MFWVLNTSLTDIVYNPERIIGVTLVISLGIILRERI
jgi:hypothetical protein